MARSNDKSLFDEFSESLAGQFSKDDLHVFPNEELFFFQRFDVRLEVADALQTFYRTHFGLQKFYNGLADLPFHLILSLIPDDTLKTTLEQKGLKVQFGFQPIRENPEPIAKLPSIDEPLIYNLLSKSDNDQQLILTFDDLFTYLSNIFGPKDFPTNLNAVLRNANTYIFLGAMFDKWYMHLLLKKLCAHEAYRAAAVTSLQHNALTFVMNNFSLGVIDLEPSVFINELHAKCQQEGILRSQRSGNTEEKDGRHSISSNYAVPIFISYARKDNLFKDDLKLKLFQLENSGRVKIWADDALRAGEEWSNEIAMQLKRSKIIILLISDYFLNSTYCYNIELKEALGLRQQRTDVHIVPVLVRATMFEDAAPLDKGLPLLKDLNFSPKDPGNDYQLIAVEDWAKPNHAWQQVATEIKRLLDEMNS
ncbi:TIR domain-containing protein [Spirosoma sp. HMF4905]|uniref:TIR domain-containing protein n=1 Tax=Spirosoma arboris TaxID=2682092 RepID=A0A7K1SJN7_9BACT|nr:toll/interleukin-1 receptor domain-containing protein [Spirosoma arboris]MVM33995.1 TIR domain-containing protein [Spirosoma arboris]